MIGSLNGAPAHASAPVVSGSSSSPLSGLGDKVVDVGATPGKSRLERYWGDLKPSVGRLLGRAALDPPPTWAVDQEEARQRFGLRSIEFGNWESQQIRLNWFYASMTSFDELAHKVVRISPEKIGFGGRLSLSLGARGNGFITGEAHYESLPYGIINLTKTRGQHALGHEYAHAWDNVVARAAGQRGDAYASGGRVVWTGPSPDRLKDPGVVGLMERLFERMLGTKEAPTPFFRRFMSQSKELRLRVEIWARIFEVFIAYRLKEAGLLNVFIAEPLGWYGGEFPTAREVQPVLRLIDAIIRAGFVLIDGSPAVPAQEGGDQHQRRLTKGLLYGAATRVATAARSIEARYALVELSDLIISHDPKTFKANPSYPPGCQQRDYHYDKSEHAAVRQYAANFDASFLITDTPSAIDGPPIIAGDRVVLGGNKRCMTLANLDDYQVYVRELKRRLSPYYGIDPEQVARFKRPVLVRVIEIPMTECALYSNILNRGLTQGMDLTTSTVSYARQISGRDLETIGKIFEEADTDTSAEALGKPRVARELAEIFQRADIITDRNRSEWLDQSGAFTDQGRLMLERTLLGSVLPDRALIETARSYTGQILRVLPLLVRGRALAPEWEPMQWISEAIRHESRRRSSGIEKASFTRQTSFDQAQITPEVQMVWSALDAGPRKFRTFIEGYVQQAERESKISEGFGISTPITPRAVLQAMAKKIGVECSSCGTVGTASLSDQTRTKKRAPLLRLSSSRLTKFLGRLPEGFLMIIWGPQGAGKSTLAVYLASELGKLAPVLWVMGEEKMRFGRMEDRARRMRVSLSNCTVIEAEERGRVLFSDIESYLLDGKIRFLVVDSKDTVFMDRSWRAKATVHDWNGLLDRYPHLSIILISHADTVGRIPLGGSAYRYLCSIEIKVQDRDAHVIKNWDGPRGTMKVF